MGCTPPPGRYDKLCEGLTLEFTALKVAEGCHKAFMSQADLVIIVNL
jgi:hypothetical protein